MNAQNITFSANEQVLTKTDDLLDFASNTVSYIEATFTLGTNWTGFDSVRAVWKSDYHQIATVLDANHKCVVPPEILMYRSKVYVNLVGSIAENNVLTDRLTTFPVQALVVTQNAEVDGTETVPVTPSQFEQFVEAVQDAAGSISDYSYDSEAWAVGKRGGVDVPSTDETYHNNSKYWAEQNAGLSDEVADLKEDLEQAIEDFAVPTQEAVDNWLEAHPEATTTVEDGSLTEPKFSDALKLKAIKDYVTPEMFGAKGDGVTDDTDALEEAFQHNMVFLPKKTYKVTDTITVQSEVIVSEGATITGNVDGFVLIKNGLNYVSLGSPSNDLAKGDVTLPNASLSEGDDICIWSTNLFNAERAYYNDGEFNSVCYGGKLLHGYFSDYTAENTTVYKVSFGKLNITNLTVENTDEGDTSGCVRIIGIARSVIDGLVTHSKSKYTSFEVDRCYKMSINGVFCQSSNANHGLDYGVIVCNSQDMNISCHANGYRHAISLGGSSLPLNIVNRNFKIDGVFSNYAESELGDVDLHGNAEFVNISGICNNGVILGGRNHVVHDVIINSINGYGIRCHEQLDGDFIISNCIVNSASFDYAVQFAGNITTGKASNVIISNCTFNGVDVAFIGVGGQSGDYLNVVLSNILYDTPPTYVVSDQRSTLGSRATVDNTVGVYKYVNCYINQLLSYTGTEEISLSAEASTLKTITWTNHSNKSTPYIRLFIDNPNIGGHIIYPYIYDRSYNSFRVVCKTMDNVAVTGSITLRYEVYYHDF